MHGIDAFLFPPAPIPNVLAATSTLSTFSSALQASGLGLNTTSDLTVFAPSNAAFVALSQQNPTLLSYLLANDSQAKSDLESVMRYHVVPDLFYAARIPAGTSQIPTIAGVNLNVTRVNNTSNITVNSASVTTTNILASNGVIHIIDQVRKLL